MKATGIVRNMDQLGRIVIPKELRKAFTLFVVDNGIFLPPTTALVHSVAATQT